MKKKHKRRVVTPEDAALHREATRIRSMPDKQLVAQFHRAAEPEKAVSGAQAAHSAAENTGEGSNPSDIERLVAALAEGRCKGLKGAAAYKVSQLAKEMGLM